MTKNLLLMTCAAGAMSLLAGAAQAATATAAATNTAADTSQSATNVTELVVTAEHREQSLQRVPVAVSVFTGAQRDVIGINTVADVTNFAPGFTYDPANVHAYIRGVGRQSVNVTDDQRVANYEDEFYVYSPYGLDKSSLFLSQEQIERGPQNVGGRNAAGGSIDMISVRPTDQPYGELRASVGNFGAYNIEGAVSGQVAPGLDLRLAAYDHNQDEGYFNNLAPGGGSEGNLIHEWYVEGQADWKPNDKFELWARSFFSGWNGRGDAGSRTGPVVGSFDETNLTDPNAFVGGGLFVNPNFGYAAPNGNPAANAALRAAVAAGDPDPIPTSVTLLNPGVLNNPSTNSPTSSFISPIARNVKLSGYDDFNYAATYHANGFDVKYTGGVQGYNYYLTYDGTDTGVSSFTLPGSSGNAATIAGLNNLAAAFGGAGPFPGCAAGSALCGGPRSAALPAATTLPGASPLVINPLIRSNYVEDDWWTAHDLSFQSTTDSPLQWQGGVFYYYQHYNQPYDVSDPLQPQLSHPDLAPPSAILDPALAAVSPGGFAGFAPGIAAAANPHNDILYLDYKFNVENIASYGQVSYKLNDQWKITGDLRYSWDDKWGVENARYVDFGSTLIDGLSPFFGAATPSLDVTSSQVCLTGVRGACNSGPLAPGVKSMGVILPNGYAQRQLGETDNEVTGGAGVEWQPTPDIFAYFRYGRGYEPPSFNAGQVIADPEVGAEFLNSYEVGYKESFGKQLLIDAAAFYYDYDNFQLPISISNGGVTQSEFINVPKAVSTGVEFEAYWTPVRDLSITASYSFDYTAVETGCSGAVSGGVLTPSANALCLIDTNDPAAVQPGANPFPGQLTATRDQSVKGNPLPDAPENKFAIDVAYTWHFDPGALTLSGSYAYRGRQDGTVFNRVYDNAPSWDDVDLRALWKGPHDKYEIIGYVKNLFDTTQYTVAAGGAGLLGNSDSFASAASGLSEDNIFELNPPRTYGLEVRYKFF